VHTRNYLSDNQRAIKNFVDNFTKVGFEGENGETSQTVATATKLSATRNSYCVRDGLHVVTAANTDVDGVAGP
jgi:hypothetical protein